jgi:outer membrane lipoprotein-sorting protein
MRSAIAGLFAALFTILLLGGPRASYAAPPTIESLATDKVKDLTATLTVRETDRAELRKIGGAFATTYSIKNMYATYQFPNKVRFEGKILGASLMMVYNGDMKMFRTPIKSQTKNIAGEPGQKQSLIDLGIVATDYLKTDYSGTFLRTESGLHVFKLNQRNTDNRSHEIVWVNPKTHLIEKRLSYNGDNKLMKELRYSQAREIRPGIWIPGRIEIYNQYGKFGVAQSVDDVKVNLGVDENLFKI